MQSYGSGAPAAPAVKRRTDSYEAAQQQQQSPESEEEYVNTRILRRQVQMQSTPVAPVVPMPVSGGSGSAPASVDGREEQPEFPGSSAASYQEERMRRKLQFFFMNPIEKWQAKRKFPYKFVVQVSSHPGSLAIHIWISSRLINVA